MGLFTAECRWFFEGTPEPPRLGIAPGIWSEAEDRTDHYLLARHCDTMGLKLRHGKLEIKVRCSEPAPHGDGPLAGFVETWHKISIDHPAVEALWPALTAEEGPPIKVDKRRWQIRYASKPGGVRRVAKDEQSSEGCGVELTELDLAGRHWWSLGFEAVAPADAVRGILTVTMRAFTAEFDIPSFPRQASRGYPAWLHENAGVRAR
jgi:hypothetical protein